MNFKKIIAAFTLLLMLSGNQIFAGKKKKKTAVAPQTATGQLANTAPTAKVAEKDSRGEASEQRAKEAKEAKISTDTKAIQATTPLIIQETSALSQRDDAEIYHGASNLCGWYAVWHLYQMCVDQPTFSRTDFNNFYFPNATPAFDESASNIDLQTIERMVHNIPNNCSTNTCVIAIGTHGEIYQEKAHLVNFAQLDSSMPIGIIALTTQQHWIAIRADIDLSKTPETGLLRLRFADSHDTNVMESRDPFATATRAAVQVVYNNMLQRAQLTQTMVNTRRATAFENSPTPHTNPAPASSASITLSTSSSGHCSASAPIIPLPTEKLTDQQMMRLYRQANEYGKNKQYDLAFPIYLRLAKAGSGDGQHELACCYANGWGTDRNKKEAIAWFEKAATKGKLPEAWYFMGCIYNEGDQKNGLARDIKRALTCHKLYVANDKMVIAQSCNTWIAYHQLALACTILGNAYYHGKQGVSQDVNTGQEYFAKAIKYSMLALNEDKTPQAKKGMIAHRLGDLYASGCGADYNIGLAVGFYQQAVQFGMQDALIDLGDLFRDGKTNTITNQLLLTPDAQRALEYYQQLLPPPSQSTQPAQLSTTAERALARILELAETLKEAPDSVPALTLAVRCYTIATQYGIEQINPLSTALRSSMLSALFKCGLCHYSLGQANKDTREYSESFKIFSTIVDQNPTNECAWFNLGMHYEEGFGTPKNLKKACACYLKAEKYQDPTVYETLARLAISGVDMASGEHKKPNPQEGFKYCLLGVQHNHALSLEQLRILGNSLFLGKNNLEKDLSLALQCYTAYAQYANRASSDYITILLSLADLANELERPALAYESLKTIVLTATDTKCPSYADACNRLGECYQHGLGTAKDLSEAIKHFTLATQMYPNHGMAWFNLGNCYAEQLQDQKNSNQIADCYRKAVLLGLKQAYIPLADHYVACDQIADAYTVLTLASQDSSVANPGLLRNIIKKRLQAIETSYVSLLTHMDGDPTALTTLGNIYSSPSSQYYDEKVANQCYYKAAQAEKDSAYAQYRVGQSYELGSNGSPKDEKEAFAWYTKAAQQGLDEANRALIRCYVQGIGCTKDLTTALQIHGRIRHQVEDDTYARQQIIAALEQEQKQAHEQQETQKLIQEAAILHEKALQVQKEAIKAEEIAQTYKTYINPTRLDDETALAAAQWRCGCTTHQEIKSAHPYTPQPTDLIKLEATTRNNYKEALALFQSGQKLYRDNEKTAAISDLNKAAVLGYIPAICLRGECYEALGNRARACNDYMTAAQYGDAYAQCKVATWYLEGFIGQHSNKTMAFAWYQLAVANGSQAAIAPLAKCYYTGRGTIKNIPQAIALYTRAAYNFNTEAMHILYYYYTQANDTQQAQQWLELLNQLDEKEAATTNDQDEDEEDTEAMEQPATTETKNAVPITVICDKVIERQINQFNTNIQKQLNTTIKQFKKDPLNTTQSLDIKKLKQQNNQFRIRCGKQRILFKLENGTYVITNIDRRSDTTYKKL